MLGTFSKRTAMLMQTGIEKVDESYGAKVIWVSIIVLVEGWMQRVPEVFSLVNVTFNALFQSLFW